MKKVFFSVMCASAVLFAVACQNKQSVETTNTDTAAQTVDTVAVATPTVVENVLTQNVGKYPHEIQLLTQISERVKTLMGEGYDEFEKNFNVETPIEKVSETVYSTTGCKKNSCPEYSATILFDAANDNLNIRVSRNGEVKTFAEKGEIAVPATTPAQ